jgi:hypothetical protein
VASSSEIIVSVNYPVAEIGFRVPKGRHDRKRYRPGNGQDKIPWRKERNRSVGEDKGYDKENQGSDDG